MEYFLILSDPSIRGYCVVDIMQFSRFDRGSYRTLKVWANCRREDAEIVEVVNRATGAIVYSI